MKGFINNIYAINWIQVGVSVLSALIVGSLTIFFNKRVHFDQQWWQKKIDKYEECILTLSELEHLYNEWVKDYEYGNSNKDKLIPNQGDLLIEIEKHMFISSFYFDKKSIKALQLLNKALEDSKLNWRMVSSNPYDVIRGTCNEIEKCKKEIIKNAKKALKLVK